MDVKTRARLRADAEHLTRNQWYYEGSGLGGVDPATVIETVPALLDDLKRTEALRDALRDVLSILLLAESRQNHWVGIQTARGTVMHALVPRDLIEQAREALSALAATGQEQP